MEILTLVALIAIGAYFLKSHDQRRRIALLARHLGNYQIEKLMENLTEGYLRCLGEDDPERRQQIWGVLDATEARLAAQFSISRPSSRASMPRRRVSTSPLATLPYAHLLFPRETFDLRAAFAIHARGINEVMHNRAGRSPKDKAYMLSAELFLMQHTCHWFCKSKMVASARMLARHKTPYEQLIASVSEGTRRDYLALIGRQ